MTPCYTVEITTPKKFVLNGLWFGPYSAKASKGKPKKARTVYIIIHGLGSSLWKNLFLSLADVLTQKGIAVLVFNNRGHDRVSGLYRAGWAGKRVWAGGASEVFTDCADDIQGAINFAKKNGGKNIFLVGHSTGCQKSVYWASRRKGGRGVKGIVLLAPMSDYSTLATAYSKTSVARSTKLARELVRKGRKHELLPQSVWPAIDDAQRFLSLYSGEGPEEIFTYWDAKKNPRALKSVKVPLLVLLAEKDEYGDRPAKRIAEWFGKHLRGKHRTIIVPRVPHSFKGGEKAVASAIRNFMK